MAAGDACGGDSVMARRQNTETVHVRQAVTGWLSRTRMLEFTVVDVVGGVRGMLERFPTLNVNRAVSNDLIRRQQMGLLKYRMGTVDDGLSAGRPPRFYNQPYKSFENSC